MTPAVSWFILQKMKNIAAIVLAGGRGTRMKSAKPKVLHELCGRPMLAYPLRQLASVGADPVVCVVGHEADLVKERISEEAGSPKALTYRTQSPQLGTGHAVKCATGGLKGFSGDILIVSGDVPLIRRETLSGFIKFHRRSKAAVSLVTAALDDPTGYGRILRDSEGAVTGVVEHRDASALQRRVREVNCGIYIVKSEFLAAHIDSLGSENAQGEYYLPDLIAIASEEGDGVGAMLHTDPVELMGINNRSELASAAGTMRERINKSLMLSGVTIIDPASTYIDDSVKLSPDSTVYPGVHLLGESRVARGAVIEEFSRIVDSSIGAGSTVKCHSVVESSKIGKDVSIGPFARLRPGSVIKESARIGNFVEVKKSVIGRGVKAGHLSYIGDAEIGAGVNIGAGAVTCNYDGKKKFKTVIKDNAFIGSDTQLIAPVTIGKGAYIGAGSTITKDVPDGRLSLSRPEQRTFKGRFKKD